MHHRMINQNLSQINFLMPYRENLQAECQFVYTQKRFFIRLLQPVNDDPISFGGQLGPVKVITTNFYRPPGRFVSFFYDLRQNVAMEAFASHYKNSSDNRSHNQNQQDCRDPANDSFPSHKCSSISSS